MLLFAGSRSMKFENLAILLTCHSLEDFPVHHEGEDANSLLANWTALWHPQLIADAQKIPTWIRTFEVPENCENHLLLCPTTSDSELQTGFAQRVKEEGGKLIRRKIDRQEIIDTIFGDQKSAKAPLRDDFFSLGYCYLQIQLLTRQLRYSSNLDEVYFSTLVVDGATAAAQGNEELATEKLQAAFDLLLEERDNYYPVNALLIDLTLVAESTLGDSLFRQLDGSSIHNNYLISGDLAEKIAQTPDLAGKLSQKVQNGESSVIGGTFGESRIPLLSVESVIDEFARGQSAYSQHVGRQVDFYGRRRYGLATSLPQILEHFGFRGAFHFTLDDGRFPEGMQIKSFWEGDGEARIEVFGKVPLDANSPGNFLNLGVKIGESFDMDHAAAICFVHWPDQFSIWYDDLRRIEKYGTVLGRFVSATEFLAEMEEPYQHDHFTPDQYQSPYFKQAVIRNQANPISKSVEYWRRTLLFDSAKAFDFLYSIFSNQRPPENSEKVSLSEIVDEFEAKTESTSELDVRLQEMQNESASRFVEACSKESANDEHQVLLNPESLVQRTSVFLDNASPAIEKPVYSASKLDSRDQQPIHLVADVPAMGYVALQNAASASPKGRSQMIVDETSIRNEFIEVIIDQTTGGIRAVHDYKTRGNRMSQILAFRGKSKEDSDRFQYSSMKIESLETLDNSVSFGRIRTAGYLEFGGEQVAKFVQHFSLAKGSRVIEVDVELSELESPRSDPWNNYFGSRFAFGDESSLISTTLNQSRQPVSGNRMEAPHFVDLENLKSRTTILTGGVPFHVRRGDRYIDSIYVVKNETSRRFRFGIGVDLANPLYHANALLREPVIVSTSRTLQPPYCWLFHLDSKNVYATRWLPIFEEEKVVGFRVRILETMGRETKCKLSSFRNIQSANRIRFHGDSVEELSVKDGKAELHFSANQLLEIEARW